MKYLWHNKILLVILILFVVMFPVTISLPQQSRSENIVTAIGIDKSGEEYEVSLQYLIPYAGSSQDALKCASMKGRTVGEAIEKFNLDFGKVSGFAHCRVVVFNDEASDGNLTEILDYLQRIKTNTNNIYLVNTKDSAKDLLASVQDLNSEFYVILSRDSVAGQHNHYQSLKSFGEYYDSILGPVKCIAINNIDLENNQGTGTSGSSNGAEGGGGNSSGESSSSSTDSSQSGSSGGSGSSSGESQSGGDSSGGDASKSSKIKNDGKLAILKDSKRILTLSPEESDNLNWFNEAVKDMTLQITNFTDEIYNNVDITFDISKRHSKIETYFKDGKPIYKLKLSVNATIIEVIEEEITKVEFVPVNNLFSNKLKVFIAEKIKEKLKKAEENFKAYKYDVVDCYETFHKFNTKEFKNYLDSLGQDEYFLDNVIFEYEINIMQWD